MVDLHKRVLHKSDCQCKQNSQRRRKILQNIFEVEIRNKHRSTKFRLSLFHKGKCYRSSLHNFFNRASTEVSQTQHTTISTYNANGGPLLFITRCFRSQKAKRKVSIVILKISYCAAVFYARKKAKIRTYLPTSHPFDGVFSVQLKFSRRNEKVKDQ